MKNRFLVACCLALFVQGALTDEIIDSGWVEVKAAELKKGLEGPRVEFSDINVLERGAIHSSALSVIRMEMTAKSRVDYPLYFDIDTVARDESGEILFVLKLSPHIFGVRPETQDVFSQSVYVAPGTLDRVSTYEFRFIGFK
jgi:hypothetical protein